MPVAFRVFRGPAASTTQHPLVRTLGRRVFQKGRGFGTGPADGASAARARCPLRALAEMPCPTGPRTPRSTVFAEPHPITVRLPLGPSPRRCIVLNSSLQAGLLRLACGSLDLLHEFIEINRVDIIRRCRAKVAARSMPSPTPAEIDHGVPVFLVALPRLALAILTTI